MSHISHETFNALGEAVKAGYLTDEQASQLVRESVNPSGSSAPPASKPPWADNVAADKRIDLEKLSDNIERAEGVSHTEALQRAIRMAPADAAPLIAEEAKRFTDRAEAAARAEWANSTEGIAALGAERRAEEARIAETVANMRPELEARGYPVEGLSDREILGMVNAEQARRAEAAQASDLQANLDAIAKMDAQPRWGETPASGEGGEGQ